MNLKIIDKKENPLLSRIELSAEISFEKATLSNQEVKKQIASELKADENLVVVKNIYTQFGSPKANVTAFVYNSKKDLEKVEPKPKEKKEAKKSAEKPAEASKKETKPEAPKEKKPAEEAKPAEAPKGEAKEEKKEATPAASKEEAKKAGKE